MQTRKLGNSGIEVSVVGVGCNNFGRRIHDVAGARAVVDRAIDLGITLFDTADVYGNGASESLLGESLGPRRNRIVIATKFGWGSPSGGSRRTISRTVEASLKRPAHRHHRSLPGPFPRPEHADRRDPARAR